MGLKSALKGPIGFIAAPFTLPFAGINYTLKPLQKALLPKLPTPEGAPKPLLSFPVTNEFAQVGDPFPLLAGRPRIYPQLLSTYKYYENGQEITVLYLRVCDGYASLRDLRAGDLPITSLGGVNFWELISGERPPPDAPPVWVYTNTDAEGVELTGGALDLRPFAANVTFAAGTGPVAVTVNSDDDAFDDVLPGTRFNVVGTASNNAQWILDSITDARHVTAHRVDGVAAVAENVDCTLNVYYVSDSGSVYVGMTEDLQGDDDNPDDVMIGFSAGDGVRGIVTGPHDLAWGKFRVGDIVQFARTSSNDGIDFQILAIAGAQAVVSPAPTTEAANLCSGVLVRRDFGAYPCCPAGTTTSRVGCNILFNSGLYRTDSKGKRKTLSLGLEVLVQLIDDAGNPTGPITSLGEKVFSGNDITPQRHTLWFDVPDGRYQLFVARTSPASDDGNRADTMTLGSVMSVITAGAVDPAYDEFCTRLLLKIRATSAIVSGADRKINGIWQAMHPLYVDGAWTEPRPTNDIAPFWAALRRRRGFEIDLADYQAAHAYWQAQGWQLHLWATGEASLAELTDTVLAAGDAKKRYRWQTGLDGIWVDRQQDLPTLVIGDHNRGVDGIKTLPVGLLPEDAPTGVIGSYIDPYTGDKRELPVVGDGTAPSAITYDGVTSRQQAWELANRDWLRLSLRRRQIDAPVSWLQVQLFRGSPVLVQSYAHGWGQFAWLAGKSGLNVMAASGFEWGPSAQVWFVDRSGAHVGPIAVTQGSNAGLLVLASDPGPMSAGEDGDDPVGIIFGCEGRMPTRWLVSAVSASSGPVQASLTLEEDDAGVYADPGPAPADEYPVAGDPPDLEIVDLTVAVSGQTLTPSWTPPAAQVAAQVEYQAQGATSWSALPLVVAGTARIDVPYGGTWRVRVRALGSAGFIGPTSDPVSAVVVTPPLAVALLGSPLGTRGTTSSLRSVLFSASISGGKPPYTGSLVKLSGDSRITVASPGSLFSTIRASSLVKGESTSASIRFEIQDSLGATAVSPAKTVTFIRAASAGPETQT